MNDERKTKAQLVRELAHLRRRVAELEARDTERGEEPAHSQRLLLALSQAAQAVQRARTPEAVYHAIGEQVTELGLGAAVLTLSEDREYLIVSYLTRMSGLMRMAEKLTGLSVEGYRFPLTPNGFFQQCITSGEAVFDGLDVARIAEVLPQSIGPLAERLADLFGRHRAIIYTPLAVGDEVQGLLAVTGTDLTQSAVPAVKAFANQAAVALENARLYKEAQQLATFNQSIIQNMVEGIAVQDIEGILTFVNPAAAARLGYAPDELIGQHWTIFIPPDQRSLVWAADERRKRGESDRYELELVRKDGERITALVAGSPRFDKEGCFAGTMAVFTDITARKQMEEALRNNQEQLALVTDNIPLLIAYIDSEQRYLYVNQPYADWYGYTKEALIGKHIKDVIYEESYQGVIQCIKAVLQGEELSFENISYDLEGQMRAVRASYVPHFNEGGQVKAFFALIQDITEQKRAEETQARLTAQVREQAQQMEQILVTVPAGVLLLDAEGHILQANPTAEEYLAVLTEARVGGVLTHLGDCPLVKLLTSPPNKGLWHEIKIAAEGTAADSVAEHIFEVIARPMRPALDLKEDDQSVQANGPELEHWVLVIKDVTREREIQAQLQQQERLAAVGQLAAGIAHDFNNIMASIVLYAQIVGRSQVLSERDRERMTLIVQQTLYASRLIQQILDFSRRSVLERHPLDLLPLFKEQVKLLEQTLPEQIGIELDYGQDVYAVHADPTRMQKMLTNLVVNARDAMLDGGDLRIRLNRIVIKRDQTPPLPEMDAGEWIRLTVSDTGTGIPPNVLPHIFEPFFTTKQPGEGSGLGLAQVYGIVGLHEGYMDVETQVGEGTTFTIYLPALDVRSIAPSSFDIATVPQGRGEVILVVEDDAALRTALTEILEFLNYQTLEAANGQEALALIEAHGKQIALVLSEMAMSGMGGIALFRALRERERHLPWQTPVVLLTTHPMDKEFEDLQEQGVSTCWYNTLTKPPSFEQLAQALAKALR